MRRPRRRSYEISIGERFGHGEIDVRAPGLCHIGADSRIGTALLPFQYAGGSEDLRGVADRGDGFAGLGKVADDFYHSRIQTDVFGCAAARENERVILFGLDLLKRGVQREIVASLQTALDARRQRIIVSNAEVNPVKWWCLYLQAFCELMLIALVHCDNRLTSALALGLFATGVAASVLLIAAHDRPFTGQISIGPEPLLQIMPGEAGKG